MLDQQVINGRELFVTYDDDGDGDDDDRIAKVLVCYTKQIIEDIHFLMQASPIGQPHHH